MVIFWVERVVIRKNVRIFSRFQKWVKMSGKYFFGEVKECQKMDLKGVKMSEIPHFGKHTSWEFSGIYTHG